MVTVAVTGADGVVVVDAVAGATPGVATGVATRTGSVLIGSLAGTVGLVTVVDVAAAGGTIGDVETATGAGVATPAATTGLTSGVASGRGVPATLVAAEDGVLASCNACC
jgi:hypothetical protein